MSQSLSKIYIHCTFATRGRQKLINKEIAPHLHSYMASIFKDLDNPALIINSMPDHVHILFRMSKNVAITEIVEHVKKSSSKWIKKQPAGQQTFYWQKGYGAFSVSRSHVDIVRKYIANQEVHHAKMTYIDEVDSLMKKYEVDGYIPDYYWDL